MKGCIKGLSVGVCLGVVIYFPIFAALFLWDETKLQFGGGAIGLLVGIGPNGGVLARTTNAEFPRPL
jgi:hypothetical protein